MVFLYIKMEKYIVSGTISGIVYTFLSIAFQKLESILIGRKLKEEDLNFHQFNLDLVKVKFWNRLCLIFIPPIIGYSSFIVFDYFIPNND
jgi:hypothetical protein